MKQHYIDEKTGISYSLQGDYYLPDFVLPAEENRSVGVWGQRHLRYLKQHCKVLYTNLLTSGKLRSYLANIDEQAETMFFRLVEQMAQLNGVTESLKASDQMAWVQKMNNIRNSAQEIVYAELIYR